MKINLSMLEKFVLPFCLHLLSDLLKKIAALTPEEQAADVDALNAKIGGPKKFEAASLAIIVTAAKEYIELVGA
jgi:hypothetical protein